MKNRHQCQSIRGKKLESIFGKNLQLFYNFCIKIFCGPTSPSGKYLCVFSQSKTFSNCRKT
jgi:hypothetical protein